MERRLPGLKPYPGGIQKEGQCAGGYKTHRNQKIVKNLIKRDLKNKRFYDDGWSSKLRHVRQSNTESATVSVLNLDIIFSVNWKNKNVSFFKVPVTFRGPGLAGTYDPRRKVAGQRWTKEPRQARPNLRAMRRLQVRDKIMFFLFKTNSFCYTGENGTGLGCQQ